MMINRDSTSSALLFVDTWGWCTIADPDEIKHQEVKEILEKLPKSHNHLITTNLVLAETYTLVRFRVHHQAALELHRKIETLISTRLLKVIYISDELEKAAGRFLSAIQIRIFPLLIVLHLLQCG